MAFTLDLVPSTLIRGRKSQIALEYVFRHRSADTAVFWVYASNTSRFIESYKRIASECQIPDRDDPSSDTLQLVRDWLESSYPSGWLMVVDSVDDRAMFFEQNEKSATEKPLIEYMPQTSKGTIIYTTRSRDVGVDLSPRNDPIAQGLVLPQPEVVRAVHPVAVELHEGALVQQKLDALAGRHLALLALALYRLLGGRMLRGLAQLL